MGRLKTENDEDCRLGTYYRINPDLKGYVPRPQYIMEFERKLITRFRTGSHSLNIELGRYCNTPRESRLCSCGYGVQTVWHIFKDCPLTKEIIHSNFSSLYEIFSDDNIHKHLLLLTKKLKIPIGRT